MVWICVYPGNNACHETGAGKLAYRYRGQDQLGNNEKLPYANIDTIPSESKQIEQKVAFMAVTAPCPAQGGQDPVQ